MQIFTQLTFKKTSPAHHFSCLSNTLLPQSPQASSGMVQRRGASSTGALLPRQRAWHAAPCCSQGPEAEGAGDTRAALQTGLPCQGAAVWCSIPGSRTPRTPSSSQEPSSCLAQHQSQGTTEAAVTISVKFSSESRAKEVTQSQTKNNICPIVTLPALLQGGGVPTKCIHKGTTYFHSRNTN